MNNKQFYVGSVTLGIAITLHSLDLTMIKISFSDVTLSTMTIYPVAFFVLLGLSLMYYGIQPLWRN